MDPRSVNLNKVHDPLLVGLSEFQKEIVLEFSRIYTGLEYIATTETMNLSVTGKTNMRKAQAQVQRLRLKLIDHYKSGDGS